MSQKDETVRINIYVHDREIRKRVKQAAAGAGQSMSEYCLDAILDRLRGDGIGFAPRREDEDPDDVVEKMRAFRKKVFGDRMISISAAELVRESREQH
ncbi:MAG: hypothetical protein KY397_04800 [Gemmatimonadetes bacterium]|nr:hypothetical protein [Gemmatimonadota bacterium]